MKLSWQEEQLADFLTTAKLRRALADREQELVDLRHQYPTATEGDIQNIANHARISRAQFRLLAKHFLSRIPGR